ncbi:MAG TPA: calcium-binding protein [Actinomycetota bacterium]|nr:calcium-binding protein [Actinomycetota bacterium]
MPRAVRFVALIAGLAVASAAAGAQASRPPRAWTCLGRPATVVGSPGADRLVGTNGRDVIVGRGGNDEIVGHDGDDLLCGGDGRDRIEGRYGDDEIDAGAGNDVADGGPDGDLLVGGIGSDRLSGGDGGFGDTLVGGDGSDTLDGGDGRRDSDFLFGGASGDFLDGGLGARDMLYGGSASDDFTGGIVSFELATGPAIVGLAAEPSGTSYAPGEDADDLLSDIGGIVGTPYSDDVSGSDAAETFRGLDGDDRIDAAGGDDDVDGGAGSDVLVGGAGRDPLRYEDSPVGVTASLRDGTAGGDHLAGFEDLFGSFFDDTLTGDDGPNHVDGSFGTNTIFAAGGDDYLAWAADGDAGDGRDTCAYSGNVSGCEATMEAVFEALPSVSDPVHREELERLGVVSGEAFGDPRRVLVGIRRMTPDGCAWWDETDSRFEPGACGNVRGAKLRAPEGEWALRVRRTLRPGAYLVAAQWADSSGRLHCEAVFAPSCVAFDVR